VISDDLDPVISPAPAMTYGVEWASNDGHRIVKFGISSKPSRWEGFTRLGGRLVLLLPDAWLSGYPSEGHMHQSAETFADRAFNQKAEAAPYLGAACGGWTECYRVPDHLTTAAFVMECLYGAYATAESIHGFGGLLLAVAEQNERMGCYPRARHATDFDYPLAPTDEGDESAGT